MKPHRLSVTNALVIGYGLYKQIHNFYNPRPATQEELEVYHDSDYIGFLSRSVEPVLNHQIRINSQDTGQSNPRKPERDETYD